MELHDGIPVITFTSRSELRDWLKITHASSAGIWVRLYKVTSTVTSIKFAELLDEGLCFGWSESLRHAYDHDSYLQKFTPRRSKGTTSPRNKAHLKQLIEQGLMTPAGLSVLGPHDLD